MQVLTPKHAQAGVDDVTLVSCSLIMSYSAKEFLVNFMYYEEIYEF